VSDQTSGHTLTKENLLANEQRREIIDESDVYIDVQKGLRRTNQAPKSRVPKGEVVTDPDDTLANGQENLIDLDEDTKDPHSAMRRTTTSTGHADGHRPSLSASPHVQHLRRTSSTTHSSGGEGMQKRAKPDLRDQWKHLGPSNLASRPKTTRYNTVKIKPGGIPENRTLDNTPRPSVAERGGAAAQGGVGAGLLSSAGKDASDGVLAVHAGYGSIHSGSPPSPKKTRRESLVGSKSAGEDNPRPDQTRSKSQHRSRAGSESTLGSLDFGTRSDLPKRGATRSGSITEQIVDAGGIKKTVLEMTSSSDDHDQEEGGAKVQGDNDGPSDVKENDKPGDGSGRKKRRRKKRTGGRGATDGEDTPLLGDGK